MTIYLVTVLALTGSTWAVDAWQFQWGTEISSSVGYHNGDAPDGFANVNCYTCTWTGSYWGANLNGNLDVTLDAEYTINEVWMATYKDWKGRGGLTGVTVYASTTGFTGMTNIGRISVPSTPNDSWSGYGKITGLNVQAKYLRFDDFSANALANIGPGQIWGTPEPATVAILGLGSLVLLRKRR